jgi:hypothetical protein
MNEMVLRVVLMVPLLWLAALVIWLLIHYDSKGTFMTNVSILMSDNEAVIVERSRNERHVAVPWNRSVQTNCR